MLNQTRRLSAKKTNEKRKKMSAGAYGTRLRETEKGRNEKKQKAEGNETSGAQLVNPQEKKRIGGRKGGFE